jgi:hypothetical protein
MLHAVEKDDDGNETGGFDQLGCEEALDRMAVHMLGEERVAEIKIAAIEKAMRLIKEILKGLGHGRDSQELFDAACAAMDEDGDGQIDAEEYKAFSFVLNSNFETMQYVFYLYILSLPGD